jgi:hypothetical protein
MHYLYTKHLRQNTDLTFEDLMDELMSRRVTDEIFVDFNKLLGLSSTEKSTPTNFDCLRETVKVIDDECGGLGEYGMKYIQNLVNACENPKIQQKKINQVLVKLCMEEGFRPHFD